MRKWARKQILWPVVAAMLLLATAIAAQFAYLEWKHREPYFQDDFDRAADSQTRQGGWQAFGGTWQVVHGVMQNIADDRGAKLMNGDTHWQRWFARGPAKTDRCRPWRGRRRWMRGNKGTFHWDRRMGWWRRSCRQ